MYGEDIQAEEQILPKMTVSLHAFQVTVGRCHEADIHRDLMHAANTTQGPLFKNA